MATPTYKVNTGYTQPGKPVASQEDLKSRIHRTTGQAEADIQNAALGSTAPAAATPNTAIATGSDYMSLWNQAYPEASAAPTNTLARSQADVDSMSIRDRLWDSANFTYGQQRQESDRNYDQAMSQFNNQQLARGMQRSSYGAATSANIANKKVEAQNQIYGQQIADYENRLMQVEQQEEAQRQFNAQMGMQWLEQILKKKGDPSDELLAQIGLSRADYNSMKKSSGGGGGGGSTSSGGGGGRKSGNNSGNQNGVGDLFGSDAGYNTGGSSAVGKISGVGAKIGTPVTGGSDYKSSNTSTGTTNSYFGSLKDKVKK